MNVSTPPSLDIACPQAEADNDKYVHMFRGRGVDKIKYEHEGIMIIYLYIKNALRANEKKENKLEILTKIRNI